MLENEKETRFDRFTRVFTLVVFCFRGSTVSFFTKRFLEQGVNTEKKFLLFNFSLSPAIPTTATGITGSLKRNFDLNIKLNKNSI
jgi:hypothetical protein